MPQDRYESLLLDRAHARRRWENQPAVDVRLEDLDREEILRTRQAAIEQRRISAGTSTDIGDILDRLGLRRDGVITQAAQMLYGTRFLPDYPQGLVKMGRFRGTKITGDILDNKQEHMHAFAIVREGIAFLDRILPLAARFPEGKIFREDRLPVPPNALREILLNAVMHRDYSRPGSYVAIAIFDDRIEIRSTGRLPAGVTVPMLSRPHLSELRNPLIAEAFHRTGAVEIWGRGTNRVIAECEAYGIDPPEFAEDEVGLVVTFRAAIGPGAVEGHQVVRPLLDAGLLAMTVPDKPTSSKQKYRTTEAGKRFLAT
jgi:ATP-dependent DNA helicase RecG